jgi:hypothetical protein
MKRFIVTFVALIAGVVGVNLVVATPASAGISACNFPAICGWDVANYGANPLVEIQANGFTGCLSLPAGQTNRITSIWNRDSHRVRFWSGQGCSGTYFLLVNSNGTAADLNGQNINNNIESMFIGA